MTIINREKRFIFIKSHKTASTSIEMHLILDSTLGEDVYWTSDSIREYGLPTRRRALVFANRNLPLAFGNGFWDPLHPCIGVINTLIARLSHKLGRGLPKFPLVSQHCPAEDVKRMVGADFWEMSTRAIPVRNPWDLVVSWYAWHTQGPGRGGVFEDMSFRDFVEWFCLAYPRNGVSKAGEQVAKFYFCGQEAAASEPIFFEAIEESLTALASTLNVSIGRLNMRLKATNRDRDYRTYYSDATAEMVRHAYERHLALYNYRFDCVGCPP